MALCVSDVVCFVVRLFRLKRISLSHILCACVFQLLAGFAAALGEGAKSSTPIDKSPILNLETLQQIGVNGLNVLLSLPDSGHFRQPLLSLLLANLAADDAANLACCSTSLVYTARAHFPCDDLGEFARKYAVGVEHERITQLELALIEQFIKDKCTSKSGLSREHYFQRITDKALLASYRLAHIDMLLTLLHTVDNDPSLQHSPALDSLVFKIRANEQILAFLSFAQHERAAQDAFGPSPQLGPAQHVLEYLLDKLAIIPVPHVRSASVVDKVKKDLPLTRLHRYYGQFACATCANGLHSLAELKLLAAQTSLSEEQIEQKEKLQKKADKYTWHLKVLDSQLPASEKVLSKLDDRCLAFFADYASYDPTPNVAEKDKKRITSMIFVFMNKKAERMYLDVLVQNRDHQKGDVLFDRAAFIHLFEKTNIFAKYDTLVGISDTGSKSFRSRFAFAMLASLAAHYRKLLRWVFLAERHAHNLCDSHAGLTAQAIHRYLNAREDERLHERESAWKLLSPLTDAESMARMLRQTFAEGRHKYPYQCIVLDDVDRSNSLVPPVARIPKIMRLHDITFSVDSPEVLMVKELSSDKEPRKVELQFSRKWSALGGSSQLVWCFGALLT